MKSFYMFIYITLCIYCGNFARMLSKYEDRRGLESYRLAYKKFKKFCLVYKIVSGQDRKCKYNVTLRRVRVSVVVVVE